MPKAKKLKSGSWNCRVIERYEIVNGKKKPVMHSITVKDPSPSGRKRCELMAAQYQSRRHQEGGSLTIAEAIRRYIAAKEKILSPTTLHAYKSLQDNAYEDIQSLKLSTASQEALQRWVSAYAVKHKPKTVRNAVALLRASYEMFEEYFPRLSLPQRQRPELETPEDADIKALVEKVKGTELEKAILLSAFGTLRRSEIAALDASDLKGNILTVRHALVVTDDGLVLKQPKTPGSVRAVELPPVIADKIRKDEGRLVELTPQAITDAFERARKKAGVSFRFHDLRAYAASFRHALNIPDIYIQKAGGWRSDVMKQVYRRSMEDKEDDFEKTAREHFLKVISE